MSERVLTISVKAKIKPGYDKNRVSLADHVPLDTPFSIAIASSQKCNFRCSYCSQSLSAEEKARRGYNNVLMEWETFLHIIDQLKKFDQPIRRIAFTGLGEPLVNRRTPDMVKILQQEHLASVQVDLYTNGYSLDEEMAHRLADANLTRLRISLQGLNDEQYKKVCGVEVNFKRLRDKIAYFYEHRGNTILYVKIMDAQLEAGQEKEFFDMFGDICDEIFIEHLALAQPAMGNYEGHTDNARTMFGEIARERAVCHFPFFYLQIDAEGNVFPCPPLGLPRSFSFGSAGKTPLKEIWTGKLRHALLTSMLKGERKKLEMCDGCQNFKCFTDESDNLDEKKEEILRRMEALA
jgi:radical SAM protein with 4Fe4S-binding SPASM domain